MMEKFEKRIKAAQKLLEKLTLDALLVDDAVNLFYLTGIQLSAGKLVIHRESAYLLVDGRYIEQCHERAPCDVILSSERQVVNLLTQKNAPFIRTLGFNSSSTTYEAFIDLKTQCETYNIVLTPLSNPLKELRMIKDEDEILELKRACELGSKGYDFVVETLREGITEEEVAKELEIFWLRNGGMGLAFDSIIAFGPNSSMPHYRAGEAVLKKGDMVLIDIGVISNHYHSDMTRVVFCGEPLEKIHEIYDVVKEAQQLAVEACKPGITLGELDAVARNYIDEKGYASRFTHSLGHGIGLEIHEFPIIRNTPPYAELLLKPGMVITIEPGIYLPGLGGIRIEDSILITENGHENLTNRSKELLVVNHV